MKILFVEYPKCSTCKKARQWLEGKGIAYNSRSIKEENPSKEELKEWHEKSGLDIKRFFNTSGILYKEMQLKDKLPDAEYEMFNNKFEVKNAPGYRQRLEKGISAKG